MKKIVKKQGESLLIRFTKDECKIYNLRKDKVIEIEIKER
jgi:hypothetical protein